MFEKVNTRPVKIKISKGDKDALCIGLFGTSGPKGTKLSSVAEAFDAIIVAAIDNPTFTDLHFVTVQNNNKLYGVVRFREEGKLLEVCRYSARFREDLISEVKARLKLDRVPAAGHLNPDSHPDISLRISILTGRLSDAVGLC